MAKLKCPDNAGGLSFDGAEFTPDSDGIVDVPEEAVADALNHGFTIFTEADKKARSRS